MRILRGSLLLILAAGVLTVPGAGHAWAQDSHPGGLPDTCPEVLNGAPTGDLEMRTVPPGGSEVRDGDIITVTLRWNPTSFAGPSVHKVLDCVTVDGKFAPDLSSQERDAPNDGLSQRLFTVPADVPAGVTICDRGFVSGPGPGDTFERQKGNDECFTVAAPGPSDTGSPAPAVPHTSEEHVTAPPETSAPTGSAPTGSAPTGSGPTGPASGSDSTPDSATPSAPGAPETISTTPGPRPAGGTTPRAQAAPPVDVLASPPSARLSPDVDSAASLPTTGAGTNPLLLAGMILCAGGACTMAGVRRQHRSPSPQRHCA